jgi:hypothetical protein
MGSLLILGGAEIMYFRSLKKSILLIIPLILFIYPVFAFYTNTTCLNDSALLEQTEFSYYIDGALDSTNIFNHTVTCLHGCYSGSCAESSKNNGALISSLMIASSIFLGWISFKFDTGKPESYAMQTLFFSLSLFLLVGSFFGFYLVADLNGLQSLSSIMFTLFNVSWIITVLVLLLTYTFFIKDIIESYKLKQNEKNEY